MTADEDEGKAESGVFDPSGASRGMEVDEVKAGNVGGSKLQQLKHEKLEAKSNNATLSSSSTPNEDIVGVLSEGVLLSGLEDQVNTLSDADSFNDEHHHYCDRTSHNDSNNVNGKDSNKGSECDSGESNDAEIPDQMSSNEKEELLRDMFPSVGGDTVSETLESVSGNYSAALDQLLNLVYFAEAAGSSDEDGSGSSCHGSSNGGSAIGSQKKSRKEMRSIDAFALDEEESIYNHGQRPGRRNRRTRNGRGRVQQAEGTAMAANAKAQPASCLLGTVSDTSVTSKNKWEIARDHVYYISSRVNKPQSAVASVYHEHGASVSATILALMEEAEQEQKRNASLKAEVEKEELDLILEAQAIALAEDFPQLPAAQLVSLVRLTHPSQSAAYDLAEVLQQPPDSLSLYSSAISAPSNPSPADPPSNNLQSASSQFRNGHRQTGSNSTTTTTSTTSSSSTDKTPMSSTYPHMSATNTPAHHFTAAARYARRANRNNHFGGAAAYHAQRGHEALSVQRAARSSAADALVRSRTNHQTHNRSTSGDIVLDLHGLTVSDALRIVRREASCWWDSLGEDRAGVIGLDGGWAGRFQGAKRRPELVLVTGRGQHSQGGRAKVGPAVIDMLVREGWKVEIGSGVVYVTGKKKRR